MTALLEIDDLTVAVRHGPILVDQLSLRIRPGEALGLVGESGSGKSVSAFAIMGLFPSPDISVTQGRIVFDGQDLRTLDATAMRRLRGAEIGIIFQDPSAYLDPLMRVGDQVAEALRVHGQTTDVAGSVVALLAQVELPVEIARRYPHELSGGQRQRVLIAAALAMRPRLLIADEPTTALDATVQAEILDLLQSLQAELGLAILLISHDLAVVAQRCQRVAVMYAGQIVEEGPAEALFTAPRHPYTQGLVRSTLATDENAERLFSIPGRVPPASAWPRGCRFHPRCPANVADPCQMHQPPLMPRDAHRADRCWRSAPTLRAWADVV